jgi:hypothetical protein
VYQTDTDSRDSEIEILFGCRCVSDKDRHKRQGEGHKERDCLGMNEGGTETGRKKDRQKRERKVCACGSVR